MVRAPVVFTFVALLACGAERPDPEREVVEVITPPTGMYQVTARVLSDSCVPAWVPPAPWRSFVEAEATRDRAELEVSVSAVPPETRTDLDLRHGVKLRPALGSRRKFINPDCPTPIGEEFMEILGVARDGFTLAISVTRDENGGCVTQPACMTRVEHEFQLVEPMCAASCTRGAKPTSQEPLPGEPQRMQVECDC